MKKKYAMRLNEERNNEKQEAREQLVRQIDDEEGLTQEYCDIDTPDTEEGPLPLEEELMKDDLSYTGKIERGRAIWKILEQGSVRENSLSKDNREALKIYRKNTPMRNLSNAELRIWQQQLLDNISNPSDREVIWVWGQTGNEGKTWFQGYLETLYGYARVVRIHLKMKIANVIHALTKQPLSTKDMFLFNEPRSTSHELCNYSILESIKDGSAVSSKYNNDVLRFKIPNVVVVFSNQMPNTGQLSKDRWKIFRIVMAGLKGTTIQVWKNQHGNNTFESNLKKENDDEDDDTEF